MVAEKLGYRSALLIGDALKPNDNEVMRRVGVVADEMILH